MRDPYEVLGVDRKASAADIKSAFRRLAKKLHPDANKNDPKAASRFAEINAAYEILGEEDKRKAFDRGEIDAEGKPRFRGFEGFGGGAGAAPGRGGFGPETEFETFSFGPEGFTRGARRGRAGSGGRRRFRRLRRCLARGLRRRGARRGGGGAAFEAEDFGGGVGANVAAALTVSLPDAAHGVTQRVRLPSGKDVEVKIPGRHHQRPAESGFAAKAWRGRAAPAIVLITVSIAPASTFTLDGADIRLDLPVTLYEAALGAKVRVPTLDRPVELTIPPGTSSGRTFRLKGKGFPAKAGRGDLLATVRIMLPEEIDPDFEALMKKWRTEKPYDPRKGM